MPGFLHRTDVWFFTFVLAVLYPLADYFLYDHLKSVLQVYVWNILAAWFLSAVAAWLIFRSGLSLADFGQTLGTYPRTLIVCGVLVVLISGVVLINKLQKRKPSPEKMAKSLEKLRKLLPATGRERFAFVFVALTAGFCEEFLFRGWLLNVTSRALHSIWLGLLLSSILFGFAHLYQGRNGVIGTAVLGLIFGLVYIASGSLLPAQLFHATLDLNNGMAFGKILTAAGSQLPESS
jgi:CAAX protease family protein